jgi:F1F0 ATPase subunit 2
MADLVIGLAAALAGGALAALHLGGLWATVQRLPTSQHRVLLTVGSLLVRLTVVAAGFVLVMGGDRDVTRLLAALGGFVAVRTVLVWRVRRGALSGPSTPTSPSVSSSEVQP